MLQRIARNGLPIFVVPTGKEGITQPQKTPKSLPDKKIGVAQKTPKVSNMGSLGKKIGAVRPVFVHYCRCFFQVLVPYSWTTSFILSC